MVVLEAGDLVVADGRIINNYSLQVNESSLTGESTNVDKTMITLLRKSRSQTEQIWYIRAVW